MGKKQVTIGVLCIGFAMLIAGFLSGFYYGTGQLPSGNMNSTVYLPPEQRPDVSVVDVGVAIMEDTVDQQEYREGYNCVDYAWDTMRNLSWRGIPSYIVALEFEDNTRHAILAIPTEDQGLVWLDPQADAYVKVHKGIVYNGKRVEDIKVMMIVWTPIDELVETLVNCEECSNEP